MQAFPEKAAMWQSPIRKTSASFSPVDRWRCAGQESQRGQAAFSGFHFPPIAWRQVACADGSLPGQAAQGRNRTRQGRQPAVLLRPACWFVAPVSPMPAKASAAGVVPDVLAVRLGSNHHRRKLFEPVRLVAIQSGTSRLVLQTDQPEMPADLIALAYRYRWSIELFFRWFKCILGCRHLLGESLNALRIQIHAGLVASLLLSIRADPKPARSTSEMVCHCMAGWAMEEELQRYLDENSRQASGPWQTVCRTVWARPVQHPCPWRGAGRPRRQAGDRGAPGRVRLLTAASTVTLCVGPAVRKRRQAAQR